MGKQNRRRRFGAGVLALAALAFLSGCSGTSSSGGDTYVISSNGGITVSSGAISNSNGAWTFDAGTIPQYATETVTFTVTNSGKAAFTAQGSISNSDFATDLSGSFSVQPGTSSSFTATFTPTQFAQETGVLTLTPTIGSPIVINLKGTPDQSFVVMQGKSQITNTTPATTIVGGEVLFTIVDNEAYDVNLTGGPNYASIGTLPGLTISTQPTSPVVPTPPAPDQIGVRASAPPGNTDTVTVSGTDLAANGAPFSFSFQVNDNNPG